MIRPMLLASLFCLSNAFAEDLGVAQFNAQLQAQHGLLLDVRTPGEVARGKLSGASVIDFNGPKFEQKVSLIARDRRVFVYCASGNRSGQAASVMAKLGFTRVFNLSGGIRAWTGAGLPVETGPEAAASSGEGLTPEAFDALIKKEPRVLADFQTRWCAPCQKMVPVVDALAVKGVKVIKVDLDESEALGAREKVQGVPVFVLYVDGKERARISGEQTREALEALARK